MRLFLYLALRNLRLHPVRSGLVGGCMAAVCALMIVLVALTNGVKSSLMEGAIALASGHLNIQGYYKVGQGSALPLIQKVDKLIAIARASGLDTTQIVGRLKAFGKVVSTTKSIQLVVWGVDPGAEGETLGRLITAQEGGTVAEAGFARRGTISLFKAQARKLEVGPGDSVTLALPAYRGGLTTLDLKVTTILGDRGMLSMFHAFINVDDLREVYQLDPGASGQIMLFLKDAQMAASAAPRLAGALVKEGFELIDDDPAAPFWTKLDHASGEPFTGQRLEVTSWRDEIAPLAWIIDVFNAFTLLITMVLMTLVVLGLIHTQTIAIHERAGETGTMRAIGLSRKKTVVMFFLESMLLSTAGALVGCILGLAASALMNWLRIPVSAQTLQLFLMNDRLVFHSEPASLVAPLVVVGLMVTAGSLLPAWRAGRMRVGTF